MDTRNTTGAGTPYDDAFRTMIAKGGNLVIPLINEMFPTDEPISPEARIISLANELYEEEGNGKQKKLVTDSYLSINGKSYHIECQSFDDGDMLLRMFQYDMGIAMQEAAKTGSDGYYLTVKVPRSGVLFLRKTSRTPARMVVNLEAPGGSVSYTIPVARLADYTLEDIIEKKLFFLLPFYMLNVEKEFPKYEKGEIKARADVTKSLSGVLTCLDELYENKEILPAQRLLLTGVFQRVTEHMAKNYDNVRKELDAIMGGKILEFKWEKPYYEGEAKGKIDALIDMVYDGFLTEDIAAKRAKDKYGMPEDKFRAMMTSYHPNDERMQG